VKDGPIEIWDVHTRDVATPLEGNWGVVAISRDGKRLAIEKKDRTIHVWNTANFFADAFLNDESLRTPIATLSAPASILSLALSPDGSRLVAGLDTRENTVAVWKAPTQPDQSCKINRRP
jgi:WD40 repeat protein